MQAHWKPGSDDDDHLKGNYSLRFTKHLPLQQIIRFALYLLLWPAAAAATASLFRSLIHLYVCVYVLNPEFEFNVLCTRFSAVDMSYIDVGPNNNKQQQ